MTWSRVLATLLVVVAIGTSTLEGWAGDPAPANEAGSTAAAVVSDVFYVPGKAIVCGASGVLWVATMALTFGALYQEAADLVRGGCGGTWVLTGQDIKPAQSY